MSWILRAVYPGLIVITLRQTTDGRPDDDNSLDLSVGQKVIEVDKDELDLIREKN